MTRRDKGWFDLVAAMPWPAGFVLGIVLFVAIRYGVGWLLASSSNPFLSAFGKAGQSGAYAPFGWLLLGVFWVAALYSFLRRGKRVRLLDTQTGVESLRAMDWREFEMLVGGAFRRRGYKVEETGLGGADGGIDLRLIKDGRVTLVQCKQWRNRQVDVKIVREMYGLLAHHRAQSVKIVSAGDFTPDARRFAEGKPIELIRGETLWGLVRDVQPVKLAPAPVSTSNVTVEDQVPDCPNCGSKMVKRLNRQSRGMFWGCPKFPSCRGTRQA